MFGNNPIRPPRRHDGTQLEVQSIFPTLQGEGPYAGWPAVFIRLGGCNLACSFCDTEFESYTDMALEAVVQQVVALAGQQVRLAVITGGEPLRQEIAPLCAALLARGFKVQVESNGTLYRPLPEAVEIVCSPKHTGRGYAPVRADVMAHVRAFKFIISASRPGYGEVGEVGQAHTHIPVYVQPMDEYDAEKNKQNRELALSLAMQRGYLLSLQLHKILEID
jgi:7-carboxy-7-deazaguanine synthase